MNRLLIVLQSTSPERTYPELEDLIRGTVPHEDDCFLMPLTCIVRSKYTAEEIGGVLRDKVNQEDRIIVAPLSEERWYVHNAQTVDDCFDTWP